ncbi:MAG: amidase [Rhodospirillaceae bacterium]|jgi:Asp-tRNA(Asn)/Glu-tRNA(Gln) amidotransferase A subunit family amidase|nr:amidase [Rhodospirillaceae bacterium]
MNDLDLCYMSAGEALAAFRAKSLSPVELMQAVIARCESVNPSLNAFTYTFFERALEQAGAAEKRYAAGEARALEGLPLAIKDFHAVAGEVTTLGSKIFEHNRPENTAPTVARLLDAGAIMHCRSTTPEFAHSPATHSPLWGVTRNAWNLDYTPGGSSGGAGAALAAGMTFLADGTDAGGSVRIPASASGVVGYKAPFGRNPLDRDHPLESLLHYGPMTRCVGDAALMQNVMSGAHPEDMCSLREDMVIPERPGGIKGWKVALSMDLGFFEVAPEVREKTLAAAEAFRALGCEVEEVALDWSYDIHDPYLQYWEGMAATTLAQYLPEWRDRMDPYMAGIIENGAGHTAATQYQCNLVRGQMYQALAPIFERYDVMICPALSVPSVKAEHDLADPNFEINGEPTEAYLGWNMCYPFNMVSQCPVMCVPNGFCPETGVPIGLQIVGRTFDDLSVFRAATAFEAVRSPLYDKHGARPEL